MNHKLINKLQEKISYYFHKHEILLQALTHKSASDIHNERLEFLGDAILSYIIASMLYKNFPNESEGKMSRMRAILVRENTLASIAREFNIGKCLFLGPGEIKNYGYLRESILADAIEALIGAVFLDSNIKITEKLIFHLFHSHINILISKKVQKDPKTRLQEHLQSTHFRLPIYQVIQTIGNAHEQEFIVTCKIDVLNYLVTGHGLSRRKAEQSAAQKTLAILGLDE